MDKASSYHNSPFTFMPGYEGAQPMAMGLLHKGLKTSIIFYIYKPKQDLKLLREAGLNEITECYSDFTWRG